MIKFKSLNKSNQFLNILKKSKMDNKYFTLFFDKNSTHKKSNKILNISFVMKKKIGNAVKRNKIRRKLKAIVHKLIKKRGAINRDYTYIVFGKPKAYTEKQSILMAEMTKNFKKLSK